MLYEMFGDKYGLLVFDFLEKYSSLSFTAEHITNGIIAEDTKHSSTEIEANMDKTLERLLKHNLIRVAKEEENQKYYMINEDNRTVGHIRKGLLSDADQQRK